MKTRRTYLSWRLAFVIALFLPWLSYAQIVMTNGVQKYASLAGTTATLNGRCELWVTASSTPLSGCTINLNSTDAALIFTGIKPSVVVSTYLTQVKISGAAAVADSNCRIVAYGMGAIVLPHNSTFKPLTVFTGPHFTGISSNFGQYTYYNSSSLLGAINASGGSFKLKRGYAVTIAANANGSSASRNYVAADGDLEISVLPGGLDKNVRFIYVTQWRWTSKKGMAGDPGNSLLNLQWWYNWNLDQNSSRDFEYVPIRDQRYWPSMSQDWKARGACQLLGYNEPDQTAQANIAVADAIYSWPDLLGTGLRVGAPAVADSGFSWITSFVSSADSANLRVDFVPLHYYWCYSPSDPNGAATQMYNFLKARYDAVKRPLWVTEWNQGANWTGCGDPSYAQQRASIAAMIAMLDSTPFVERYALYNWVETVRQVVTNGVLTGSGVSYRDEVSPIGYVQSLPSTGTRSFSQLLFETNALDSSGYGNGGVLGGSGAYTNGHTGSALVFDGANTAVTLPPNVMTGSAFTFAAWIKWNGGANWQRIFDFGNSTTHYLFLSPNAAGSNLRFAIANGGSEQQVNAPMPAQNQWVHIAVTMNGSTAIIYTNGVLAAQNTGMSISPASFSPRVNRLGKSQFVSDPMFNGVMDEVLITDYALSPALIARLQTNTPPQFTNNIFAKPGATEGILYSNSLAGTSVDPDPGDFASYSKISGPSWLTMATNGIITGTPTSGDGGTNIFTIRVTDAAGQNGFAVMTVPVTVLTASGTWTADSSANWSEPGRWSASTVATGGGQTANFSTINITANRTVTLDTPRTIGNLKFSDTVGAQAWTIAGTNSLTLETGSATVPLLSVTNTATISAPLGGTNGFTKTGPGTIILSGNNPLSGTVNVDTSSSSLNDGVTRIVGPNALVNATLIHMGNNNSGNSTFQVDGSAGSVTIDANFTITYRNNGVVTLQNVSGTNIFNGGFQLFQGGNSFTVQSDSGLIVFTGTNQYVGALSGVRTNYFTGAGSHLLVGPIVDSTNNSPISLTKNGSGRLTVAGPNTYGNSTLGTGNTSTALNGGSLFVDGVLPQPPFRMATGTTLGGNGVINTAVTIPSGSTFSPGDNFGPLTVNSSLTLSPGSTTFIELDKGLGSNDTVVVNGLLSLGGTLTVTNYSGMLVGGDAFQIFSPSAITGDFSAFNFPPLPTGMNWNWNPASGLLSVTGVAMNSTNFTFAVSGSTLQFSWPADHLGWRLQVMTNDLNNGLNGTWFDVPGSDTITQMDVDVDAGNGSVFYRLVSP